MAKVHTGGAGLGEEAYELGFGFIDLWTCGIIHSVNIPPPLTHPQGEFSLRRGKPRIESWENVKIQGPGKC